MVIRKEIAALALAGLTGCAAIGPEYQAAPAPGPDEALVYVYRTNSQALGARDAYLYVDEINIADISRSGYTWFHVPAGRHKLVQKWPIDVSASKRIEMDVDWQAGKTYVYRLTTSMGSILPTGLGLSMTLNWQLYETSLENARPELFQTNYQPAFGASKLRAPSVSR